MTRIFEKVSIIEWLTKKPEYVEDKIWKELYLQLKFPKRATKKSAGYDFYSPFNFCLFPQEEILIPTGIKIKINDGEELSIYPRSGLGFKYYLRLANTVGIIDADYYNNENNEGHIMIKVRNESVDKMVEVNKGEGFCQGIIRNFLICDNDNFDEGEDRSGGIGSTT